MELLKETETDPLIAQKLERRLLHEIYEWRDLYEDADKEYILDGIINKKNNSIFFIKSPIKYMK